MVWRDQDPPATDVLLDFTVPFSGGGTPAYLEIDKLPEGLYRATVGTLFEYQELCRTGDLEGLLRHTRAVQSGQRASPARWRQRGGHDATLGRRCRVAHMSTATTATATDASSGVIKEDGAGQASNQERWSSGPADGVHFRPLAASGRPSSAASTGSAWPSPSPSPPTTSSACRSS